MVAEVPRKKSPRAPSMALDEAIERVVKVYDRERLHPAPVDVVAQHIGYRGSNNGSALAALASLRYFGLLERPKDGMLSVSKNVEAYKFAPNERLKRSILVGFLTSPPLYAELLEKYENALPSEANLRYELIQKGFAPASAEVVLAAFMRSVQFVDYYSSANDEQLSSNADGPMELIAGDGLIEGTVNQNTRVTAIQADIDESEVDKIPVRLSKGRRAWLIIPVPFYEADKLRLKAQLDLILTEEQA